MRTGFSISYVLWVAAILLAAPSVRASEDFTLLTLNLHGYHPTGEAERWLQSRDGDLRPGNSDLYYFSMEELRRGHERRLERLSEALTQTPEPPHILLLQEVGAGLPWSEKSCAEFRSQSGPDRLGKNTALLLQNRLAEKGLLYDAALACRGNRGWQTNSETFRTERSVRLVRRRDGRAGVEVVQDFGANPAPQGTIVEGTAILARAPWKILDTLEWNLRIPGTAELFFFQTARILNTETGRWLLVANLHAGHKVRHFEQAVYLREALSNYLIRHADIAHIEGVVIGGDLNARLYRPSVGRGDVSTIPWEMSIENEFRFDRKTKDQSYIELSRDLWALNLDHAYKDWASIGDGLDARERVNRAVRAFANLVRGPLSNVFSLREVLSDAVENRRCEIARFPSLEPLCIDERERIDHIFAEQKWTVSNAALVFSSNNYRSLDTVSDHPGVLVSLSRATTGRADRR